MSNGTSYPVLRTPDLAAALKAARQAVAIGVSAQSKVTVEACVPSLAEVLRLRDALPESVFMCWNIDAPGEPLPGVPDLTYPVGARDLPDGLAGAEAYLPLTVSMEDRPLGTVEDGFSEVIGPHPAEISWRHLEWPEAPGRDVYWEGTHAAVALVLNCDSRDLEVAAGTHTVFVVVRRNDHGERQARWIAEQIGQQVIGPRDDG
ncbi:MULTISPECIES: hypothetical protein [unclassified Streptomyces]|uniref:hypothetical protein n=1 Tax=unclassified Streptomyces TaxID=2593676 RepID=UPI0013A7069D|nr:MULTISPECIES: hypothetical protein [unclassified Streptomyces]